MFKLMIGLVIGLLAPLAQGHEVLESLIAIDVSVDGAVKGQWEIPLQDVEDLWSERATSVSERAALATKYQVLIRKTVFDDLAVALGGGEPCPLTFTAQGASLHKEQPYVVLPFVGACPRQAQDLRAVQLIWTFLNGSEHDHQALVRFSSAGGVQSAILSKEHAVLRFGLIGRDGLAHFLMYLHDGAWHIWTGVDHILFLMMLILPSVLVLRSKKWQAREHFRDICVDVLKTVSAFTVAHSLTLALVTLHLLTVPPTVVVSVIAVSVLVAGLNNLFPVVDQGRWRLAFLFGLVHGVGFADALVDLQLPTAVLVNSLLGFNLGVELGQLAIVAAVLPTAYWLRRTQFYRRFLFAGGSVAASLVAVLWLVDRFFHLSLIAF